MKLGVFGIVCVQKIETKRTRSEENADINCFHDTTKHYRLLDCCRVAVDDKMDDELDAIITL